MAMSTSRTRGRKKGDNLLGPGIPTLVGLLLSEENVDALFVPTLFFRHATLVFDEMHSSCNVA